MAELNYDEVTNAVYPTESEDDPWRFETRFPERLSRLVIADTDYFSFCRHGDKGRRNKASARYRTQPITFDEIAEVDEDMLMVGQQDGGSFIKALEQQQQQQPELQQQNQEILQQQHSIHTSSDKENTPCTQPDVASSAPSYCDISRQRRRRRSFRKLRNRHSVQEEIIERSEDTECAS